MKSTLISIAISYLLIKSSIGDSSITTIILRHFVEGKL